MVDQGISVRALEQIVRQEKAALAGQPTRPTGKRASGPSPHIQDMEKRLEKTVKTKVTIREGRSKGTGRIVIEYYSLDDFDRVTQMLGLDPEDVD